VAAFGGAVRAAALAFELRLAPRRHCSHTFAEIGRLEVRVLLHALMRHGAADLLDQAGAQRGARGLHRNRCRCGDLAREIDRARAHLVLRHQHVSQADAVRLGAVDAAAGVEQQRRLLHADQAWQRHRQAEPRVEAQAVEVRREAPFGAGDTKVSHQRQAQAATDRGPLHRGDHRLRAREQPQRLAVQWVDRAYAALRRRGVAIGEVGAGAKRRALRAQHDGAAARLGLQRFERVGQRGDQRHVEVVVRRAAHLDHGHRAVEVHSRVDGVVAHGRA